MKSLRYRYILSLALSTTGLLQGCSSNDQKANPKQEGSVLTPLPSAATTQLTQAKIPDAGVESSAPPTGPADAGLRPSSAMDAGADLASGVHFALGDWSGSLSERRLHSTLRQVHKKLLACAKKHQAYGEYKISYRLNNSQVAPGTKKKHRWVHPIKVDPMKTTSAPAIQCIKQSLSRQSHYMRIYKNARVSGILSLVP